MDITVKMLKKMGLPFSGWHVVREIGNGTFGSVFRIENMRGDVCALKVIPVPYSDSAMEDAMQSYGDAESARGSFDEQVKMILTREIGTAKQCGGCPYIFRIFEEAVVDDPDNRAQRYIMVRMELLTELKPYMNAPGKLQRDVLQLMEQIGTALAFLEGRHIIHRDIKPANIMVDSQGHYKLTDFGEARVTRWEGSHTIARGTPYYMAPEVSNSSHYDHRADIYSLGMVAYYLLNHMAYPFSQIGIGSRESYKKRMNGDACPPIPGVDQAINQVVLRCIAFRPEDRYANASELLRNLKELLEDRSKGQVELSTGKVVGGGGKASSENKGSERTPRRHTDSSERPGGSSERHGGSGSEQNSGGGGSSQRRFGSDGRDIDSPGSGGSAERNDGERRGGYGSAERNGGGRDGGDRTARRRFGADGRDLDDQDQQDQADGGRRVDRRGGYGGAGQNGGGRDGYDRTPRRRFGADGRDLDEEEQQGYADSGRRVERAPVGHDGETAVGDSGGGTESGSGGGGLSTTAIVLIVVGAVMLFIIIVAIIASSANRTAVNPYLYDQTITDSLNTIGPLGGR